MTRAELGEDGGGTMFMPDIAAGWKAGICFLSPLAVLHRDLKPAILEALAGNSCFIASYCVRHLMSKAAAAYGTFPPHTHVIYGVSLEMSLAGFSSSERKQKNIYLPPRKSLFSLRQLKVNEPHNVETPILLFL